MDLRPLFGYDIFISYKRADAKEYAKALAVKLEGKPYYLNCFIDETELPLGSTLRADLRRALARSKVLVTLVTGPALESEYVQFELATFASTRRPIAPINLDGALTSPQALAELPWRVIRDRETVWIDEEPSAFQRQIPSVRVLDSILNRFKFTRRRTVARAAMLLLLAVSIYSVGSTGYSWWLKQRIQSDIAGLRQAARQARDERNRAKVEAKQAWNQARDARTAAEAALQREQTANGRAQQANINAAAAQKQTAAARAAASTALSNAANAVQKQQIAESNAEKAQETAMQAGLQARAATTARAAALRDLRQVQSALTGSRAVLLAQQPGQEVEALAAALQAALPSVRQNRPLTPEAFEGLSAAVAAGQYARPLQHPEPVAWAAFGANSERVVTRASDRRAWLWDAHNGRQLPTPWGHVESLDLSSDGTTVVTTHPDGVVRLWDARTGRRSGQVDCHAPSPRSAFISPNGNRIAVFAGKEIQLWDPRAGRLLRTLERFDQTFPSTVAFSPDGARVLTEGPDHVVRIWNSHTGSLLLTLKGHSKEVYSADFSRDGSRIATASGDGTVGLWDSPTGAHIATLRREYTNHFSYVAFSPDSTRFLTIGNGQLLLWNAVTGTPLPDPHKSCQSAAFSPDGGLIVTANGSSNEVELLDGQGQPITKLAGHFNRVRHAAFSPDSKRVVTASEDGTARMWTIDASLLSLGTGRPGSGFATLSPDGQRALTRAPGESARLWDARSGRPIAQLAQGGTQEPAFSPDSTRVLMITGETGAGAHLWDAHSGRPLGTVDSPTGKLSSAAFAHNGCRIVTTADDGTISVWDASTRRRVWRRGGHGVRINSAAFSPDNSRLITAGEDGTVRLWNAATGAPLLKLQDEGDRPMASAQYSEDGTRILTVNRMDLPARVWLWDARTYHRLAELQAVRPGRFGPVWAATFSPDSQHILTHSYDLGLQLWDARTGGHVAALGRFSWLSSSFPFSRDGRQILTSGPNGAEVWDARTGRQLAILRGYGNSAAFSPDGTRIIAFNRHGVGIYPAPPTTTAALLRSAIDLLRYQPEFDRIKRYGERPTRTASAGRVRSAHTDAPLLPASRRAPHQ